jgi:hypothetical protein
MKTLIFLLFTFLFGCESTDKTPLTLTNEQAIYETVALKYISSMVKDVNILDETDGTWFQEHSLDELKEWAISKTDDEENFLAPEKMLQQLYEFNQSNDDINWVPIIINGTLISAENFQINPDYISFSKVAFSNDRKHALVQFTHHCVLCGGAWIVYLTFENQQWQIIQEWALYLS